MSDTLHSVAVRMAAAGRLPGITFAAGDDPCIVIDDGIVAEASDADLAWAAIQHAMSKGWRVEIGCTGQVFVWWHDCDGKADFRTADGTTALSVLLAVERACDAAEANGGGR